MIQPALRIIDSPEQRQHDLPPKWDGITILWRAWATIHSSMRFHAKPEKCVECGSIAERAVAAGSVPLAECASLSMSRVEGEWVRTLTPAPGHWFRLVAFRCPDCAHDTVWDVDRDEWYDLDFQDYGDEGSVE